MNTKAIIGIDTAKIDDNKEAIFVLPGNISLKQIAIIPAKETKKISTRKLEAPPPEPINKVTMKDKMSP